MIHFDPVYYLFALPGLALGIYAQIKLSSTYSHYIQVPVQNGMTGAQAAREILSRSGLPGMPVEEVQGHLTDHYDPTKKALFLSSENYHGRSIAAVGVAAHEAGHALQHRASYAMFNVRMMLVPATRIASGAVYGLFILGMILGIAQLATVAVGIFAVLALFQIVTLPVEFDASRRAKEQLFKLGLIREDEKKGVSKVLSAAAMTYVAGMVSAVLQLLYWVTIARNQDRS